MGNMDTSTESVTRHLDAPESAYHPAMLASFFTLIDGPPDGDGGIVLRPDGMIVWRTGDGHDLELAEMVTQA